MTKAKKYTTKEINDAAMAARKAAELTYTLDHVRQRNPINERLRQEATLDSEEYKQYADHDIQKIVNFLQAQQAKGATHVNFSWSTGEWADDEPMTMTCIKKKSETPDEWMARVTACRDRLLDNEYAKKQQEMLNFNRRVDEYNRLRKEFGE